MNLEAIASLTTAGGTLVLAIATFGATSSANRASRSAERSLLAGLRPVLMHARLDDPEQKIGFTDQHWVHLKGPSAAFDVGEEAIYLALAARNVGSGIAVLQGWAPAPERLLGDQAHPPLEHFRPQSRDIYVAPGDVGFWQGAFRDPTDPAYDEFVRAATDRRPITVDLLYSDLHGGQRTVTRFSVVPVGEDGWFSTVARHWMIDNLSPR